VGGRGARAVRRCVAVIGYVAGGMRTIDNRHVGEINAIVMDL
jgi:hypothetical protein